MIIYLIVGLIKKILLYKMSYFSKPHTNKNKIEAELNLSNYATKSDLKMQQSSIHCNLLKKDDLANLKSEVDKLDKVPNDLNSLKTKVDKLDIGKLETTPVDLSKLSAQVKNDVVKNTVYNELVKKFNAIDSSDFLKIDYNAKIKDIEDKIPSNTGFAATTGLNVVEGKIPNVSTLVKKAGYDEKIK